MSSRWIAPRRSRFAGALAAGLAFLSVAATAAEVEVRGRLIPAPEGVVELVLHGEGGPQACRPSLTREGLVSCRLPTVEGLAWLVVEAEGFRPWTKNLGRVTQGPIELGDVKLRVDPEYLLLKRKLRVRYLRLEGRAIDLLLDRRLSQLDETFQPEPFVGRTPIRSKLSGLRVARAPTDYGADELLVESSVERSDRRAATELPIAEMAALRRVPGTESWDRPDWSKLEIGPSLLDDWKISHLTLSPYDTVVNPLRPDTLFVDAAGWGYWRTLRCADLDLLPVGACDPASSVVAGVEVSSLGGCALEAVAERYPWVVQLSALLLENTAAEAVVIDEFLVKSIETRGLMPKSAAARELSQSRVEAMDVFPEEILNPGERIVVPLAVELSAPRALREDIEAITPEAWLDEIQGLLTEKVTRVVITALPAYLGSIMEREALKEELAAAELTPSDELAEALFKLREMEASQIWSGSPDEVPAFLESLPLAKLPSTWERLVVGDAFEVAQIRLDQRLVTVRPEPEDYFLVREAVHAGSCPYVYTRSGFSESWQREGTILTGRDAVWKSGTSTIPLARFDGTVLLREIDPETSYIDALWVEVVAEDGRVITTLQPQVGALQKEDQVYLVLHQGDERLVDFGAHSLGVGERYRLAGSGYYVLYEPRRAPVGARQAP
jgi:hypothetical protein